VGAVSILWYLQVSGGGSLFVICCVSSSVAALRTLTRALNNAEVGGGRFDIVVFAGGAVVILQASGVGGRNIVWGDAIVAKLFADIVYGQVVI
jgi:hypothetical protein